MAIGSGSAGPELASGTVYAGRYRIVGTIGRGGMGEVYLAEDTRLGGRKRALKLTEAAEGDPEAFIREARILSQLQHPNLPEIVDYEPPGPGGRAAIVMEYVAGDTLADLLQSSGGRLPFGRVLHYLRQLCEVLRYLHGRRPQIVFRDLKPANVIIDRRDRAVLVDFGIARAFEPGAAADTEKLGTPAFAAPEQLRGEQSDARTDLYGWGALACYLLSGGRFAARRPPGSLRAFLQADVPRDFREILETLLDDAPERRPQSAEELHRLLETLQQSSGEGDANLAHPDDGIAVVAVLSAYPGAGATFAALGLSRYLSSRSVPHALVELPGAEGELYGLMNGADRMPKHAAFAESSGFSEPKPAWRSGHAVYYPSAPDVRSSPPAAEFGRWLRRLGVSVVLLDVSSKWEETSAADWLAGSGIRSLWWVADCLPAKWSAGRQRAGAELRETMLRRRAKSAWIANRDHAFAGRTEWLSFFPSPPAARIPLFPGEEVARAVWAGEGFPIEGKGSGAGSKAFEAWARAVLGELR